MFSTIIFLKDFRCFQKGSVICLRPGVNLLVGDQGCGKSTLLDALDAYTKVKGKGKKDSFRHSPPGAEGAVDAIWLGPPGRFGHFDFEKGNPRTQPAFGMDERIDDSFQVSAMFSSHGQSSRAILNMLGTKVGPNVFALDEPDMALSPRSIYDLIRNLKTNVEPQSQVILAVHNPELIRSFPEVLSLEHGRWMPSQEFLDLQANTPAPVYERKPRLVKILDLPEKGENEVKIPPVSGKEKAGRRSRTR